MLSYGGDAGTMPPGCMCESKADVFSVRVFSTLLQVVLQDGEEDVTEQIQARLPGTNWKAIIGAAGTPMEQQRVSPIVELSMLLVRTHHSVTHSLTHSLTRSLTHSLARSHLLNHHHVQLFKPLMCSHGTDIHITHLLTQHHVELSMLLLS